MGDLTPEAEAAIREASRIIREDYGPKKLRELMEEWHGPSPKAVHDPKDDDPKPPPVKEEPKPEDDPKPEDEPPKKKGLWNWGDE